jgi:hypothetical protein
LLAPIQAFVRQCQEAGVAVAQRVGAQRLERVGELRAGLLQQRALLGDTFPLGRQAGLGLRARLPLEVERAPDVAGVDVALGDLLRQLVRSALAGGQPALRLADLYRRYADPTA